jgi:pyridoxal phosphate enzyme (YggS family)
MAVRSLTRLAMFLVLQTCVKSFLPQAVVQRSYITRRNMTIASNLQDVNARIQAAAAAAAAARNNNQQMSAVQLVAVSKTKPVEQLQEAYDSGQRVFGENYVQELIDKVGQLPHPDIKWHFIGTLQSNKVNALCRAFEKKHHQLTIETVASKKLATKLNAAVTAAVDGADNSQPDSTSDDTKLQVYVQVNTSNEATKGGCAPDHAADLCAYIQTKCLYLQLIGLMTIGSVNNQEFGLLRDLRDEIDATLGLSMGMSGDFERAISEGATSVRVGSTIFGERDYTTGNK